MTTTHNVLLRFHSNTNDVVRLTIPRANTALTAELAAETMQDMITGGIIITGNGIPTMVKGAEIVTTQRSPVV